MKDGLRATALVLAVAAPLASCGGREESPPAPQIPARAPASFIGVVAQDVFAGSPRYRARELGRQKRAGVRLIRQTFDWASVEIAPGRYDFRRLDGLMEATSRRRIAVLPILFNPPAFRSSAPRGTARRGTYPPAHPRDLGIFGAVLVRRYGPRGSFWRQRPGLRRSPITAWQVWNEPNLPVYWPEAPDAGEYTELLRETARELKRAV